MEFIVRIAGQTPDVAVIDEALRAVDPAAVVDVEADTLRIAGAFNAPPK